MIAPRIVVGQPERATQDRVVALLRDELGYAYQGNLAGRPDNRNIDAPALLAWLTGRGVDPAIAARAVAALEAAANNATHDIYTRNRNVYELLRYGVPVKPAQGVNTVVVELIDWRCPEANAFAVAEEVTIRGATTYANDKRPDVVLSVNGVVLGVLELKRSTVSVASGIRQNLDSQKREFVEPYFATVQLVMAGNDTEGLRYGTTATKERYYLEWREEDTSPPGPRLDADLRSLLAKPRLLEIVHDFVLFDFGTKKLCRHNQFFGVRAARDFLRRREGGIIWHTQGSGKSLTMVWLAKWIRENVADARVLLVTDRTELDEQIEGVFRGVNEEVVRTTSGADLVAKLNAPSPWLLCTLVHKFAGKAGPGDGRAVDVAKVLAALPSNFVAKGDVYVFVDECHRTQSGELHKAMKGLLPDAVFVGFTGTPLLKADKAKSVETFGRYIHTYKFNEAVRDRVVLDLRYEARDIEQSLSSPKRVDEWFDLKTANLTEHAKARLKQRWGTLSKVLSSRDRLARIVGDIALDFLQRPRLADGRGNAILVAGSIAQACKLYELFGQTELRGHCAVVTSFAPTAAAVKGEETGEGLAERLAVHETYRRMLAEWFHEPADEAVKKIDAFELAVKKRFLDEPGRMRLLIVVDKLLTGFDAPPATYLYLDKAMRDHGLFQAICRVNRLDGDDKEFGYVVDYRDLFKSLAGAVKDYTSGALDGYDAADVSGLLEDRLAKGRERLDETLEAVRALCEPVGDVNDTERGLSYFVGDDIAATAPRRAKLYRLVPPLLRAYAAVAGEMAQAGYAGPAAAAIKAEVACFENLHREVLTASGDAIDFKLYDPGMRHLIDTYVRAEESERLTSFGDMTLVQLLVARGPEALKAALPEGIAGSDTAVAETIENNVRKAIVDETPANPKYYERMSELLEALIAGRKDAAVTYADYLKQVAELAKRVQDPGGPGYPPGLDSPRLRAVYDNAGRDEALTLRIDAAVREAVQDGWRGNEAKARRVRGKLLEVLGGDETAADAMLDLVRHQDGY